MEPYHQFIRFVFICCTRCNDRSGGNMIVKQLRALPNMELCYAYGYLLRTFFLYAVFLLLIRHEVFFLQEFIQHAEWV